MEEGQRVARWPAPIFDLEGEKKWRTEDPSSSVDRHFFFSRRFLSRRVCVFVSSSFFFFGAGGFDNVCGVFVAIVFGWFGAVVSNPWLSEV